MTLITTVQKHIHLGLIGASLSSLHEPPYAFGHIQVRKPHLDMTTSFNRSRTGHAAFHVLKDDASGAPLIFRGFEYQLRVSNDELETLVSMAGLVVNLVDTRHCPDEEDHLPYIKQMAFTSINYDSNLEPLLNYNIMTIVLQDVTLRGVL